MEQSTIIAIIAIVFMISFCILLALYLVREQGKIEFQDSIQPISDLCTTCHHINCTCNMDYEEMQSDVQINLQRDQNQHIN